ncbi:hypothetical protein HanIR_Chr16g0843651 [Helianthus annuus]|nr:hypothetical protein HanIR_Chr16g0843651 [Helianthus annuus]KAJ0462571.1 hypothetical protein HanHA89_Chr16g0684831 [Helianthus annuus]KAJ0642968.1 hypothetical protein HanLR1_Chr16g0644221 [Helianthus annuus]
MLGSRMSVVVELTATKPVRSDGADDSNNNGITHTKSPLNGVVDQLRTKAYPASKLRGKMSVVCGPHLQASAREDVDQMSAVCKEKRVCFFFLQKLHTNTQHTQQRSALSLYKLSLSLQPPPLPPHHHRTTSAITGLLSLSTNSLSLYNHRPALSLSTNSLSLRSLSLTALSLSHRSALSLYKLWVLF